MEKMKVRIARTEVYYRDVEVEAGNAEDAVETARAKYENDEYSTLFDLPDAVDASFCAEPGEGGDREVSQRDVDEMGDRLDEIFETLRKAREMAFALAKAGDSGIAQLRGAADGIADAARETEGLLAGLAGLMR